MANVIKVDSNEWAVECDPNESDFTRAKLIRFADSTTIFEVVVDHDHFTADPYEALTTFTVKAEPFATQPVFAFDYTCAAGGSLVAGTLTEAEPTTRPLITDNEFVSPLIHFKLTLKPLPYNPINASVKSYIERGPTVTLIGYDGSVTVSRRLLKICSSPLEAMFDHDSKEKQTGEIKLDEFDVQTLSAFKDFLLLGQIVDGKQTALQLVLLGDKYDIQQMKEAAEKFIKKNIRYFDKDDVLDIFHKVSRQSLFDVMDTWSADHDEDQDDDEDEPW